jgi:prepilin-type N-terminal cleavage/methylation domain-containing protein
LASKHFCFPAFRNLYTPGFSGIASYLQTLRKKREIVMNNKNRGVTLTELLVAMSLSVLVLSAIFGTYSFYTRSTLGVQKTNHLRENQRLLLHKIFTQLKKSKSVTSLTENSIIFIDKSSDTIAYSFEYDSLYYSINSETPKSIKEVTGFSVATVETLSESETDWRLIRLSLSSLSRKKQAITLSLLVAARVDGSVDLWSF